jgi:hypothetical protein
MLDSKEALLGMVAKDHHEGWRLFGFLLKCLDRVDCRLDSYERLVEALRSFAETSFEKDSTRTRFLFQEFLMGGLVEQIRSSVYFEKKKELFRLVYCFFGHEPQQKKQAIVALKKEFSERADLFVQGLAVLCREERGWGEENHGLWDEFIFYANVHLQSQSASLRTMALAIYIQLAEVNHELAGQLLLKKVRQLRGMTWWENRCQVIILLAKLIRSTIKSQKYLSLIKNQNNFHKFFSLENERLINEIKESMDVYAQAVIEVVSLDHSYIVSHIFFVNCLDIVVVSRFFTEFVIEMLLLADPAKRREVLGAQDERSDEEYLFLSDKSLKYSLRIHNASLEAESAEILMRLTDMLRESRLEALSQAHVELIEYCLRHVDFKLINMESCENLANALAPLVYVALASPGLSAQACFIIEKLLGLNFHSEIRIKDNEELFAAALWLGLSRGDPGVLGDMQALVQKLVEDSQHTNIEAVHKFLEEVRQLVAKNASPQQLGLIFGAGAD